MVLKTASKILHVSTQQLSVSLNVKNEINGGFHPLPWKIVLFQNNITLILYKVYVCFFFCTERVSTFLLQTQAHKVYWEVTSWYPDGVLIFQSRSEKNSVIRPSTCMLALDFNWCMYWVFVHYKGKLVTIRRFKRSDT